MRELPSETRKGSDDAKQESAKTTPTPTLRTRATPAESPAPEQPSVPSVDPANIEAAEDAVRDELPDLPLGADKVRSHARGGVKVCVDRVLTKENAAPVGGDRTSHVVVTLPDLDTGEPQDGPCSKASENADKSIERARRFYLAMDDLAVHLDRDRRSTRRRGEGSGEDQALPGTDATAGTATCS